MTDSINNFSNWIKLRERFQQNDKTTHPTCNDFKEHVIMVFRGMFCNKKYSLEELEEAQTFMNSQWLLLPDSVREDKKEYQDLATFVQFTNDEFSRRASYMPTKRISFRSGNTSEDIEKLDNFPEETNAIYRALIKESGSGGILKLEAMIPEMKIVIKTTIDFTLNMAKVAFEKTLEKHVKK